jgi:hypothetical protein
MGFDEALGLSFVYGVLEVGCGVMLILVFWEIGCGPVVMVESRRAQRAHLPHPLSLFSLLFFQLF